MKKFYFLIIVALILGLVLSGCSLLSNIGQVPATGQSGITYLTKGETSVIPLLAGQDIPVGTVTVSNDSTNLTVLYETNSGWKMTETHLAVVTNIADFPTNKPGNPMVGHFPYGVENIFTNIWEQTIKLEDLDAMAGQTLYIAAHAVVADTSNEMEEVVVSRAGIDVYGPLDSYVGLGDPLWLSPILAVATWVHPSWPSIPDAIWISTSYLIGEEGGSIPASSWRWFCDVITLPEKGHYISGTVVLATSDNAEEVYFNGELVGSDGEVQGPSSDNHEWSTVLPYSIIPQPGLNTLDFIVRNYAGSTSPTGNPTGLIYKVSVTYYPEESAWAGEEPGEIPFPGNNWATYFNYTIPRCWSLVGDWVIKAYVGDWGSGPSYIHGMTITDDSFIGLDYYPLGNTNATGDIIDGIVTGNNVEWTNKTKVGTYEAYIVGTIAGDGTMSGTWTDSSSQSGDWKSTNGEAIPIYCNQQTETGDCSQKEE